MARHAAVPLSWQVKIRVHAAAANAADYKVREGYVRWLMPMGKTVGSERLEDV